jgi:anti-sigma regulatory factor (Ser/Thr protein kinase)
MTHAPPPPKEPRVYFEIIFRPSVILTTVVRRFITDFYENVIDSEDSVSRLALATHELLENAVKYGMPEETTTLSVDLDQREGIVTIRTSNRSDAAHIDALKRRFAEMQAAPNAFRFYQQLLRATAHETSVSGLGLARIRCEGEMDIDLKVEGDLVRISAVARTGSEFAP